MTSPIVIAKKLAEVKLASTFPTVQIAWENVSFSAPSDKYFRCNFSVRPPSDPCVGGEYYRENIVMNVFVCDKLNVGTASALTTAEEIRDAFYKGLSMQDSNVSVRVLKTPHVAGGVITSDRYVVPVSISLFVESN